MERYIEFVLNHYLLALGLAVVTFLLIQEFIESAFRKFELISPTMAVTKMNTMDTVILDIREEHEFIKGHIENSRHIPLGKLEEQIQQLANDKDKPVIVVCQTGSRSTPACKALMKHEFKNVYSLIGGMQSWEDNKLPMKITSRSKD